MKNFRPIVAAAITTLLLSSGMAMADCVDTTTAAPDSTASTKTPSISKDGTTAPLEVQPDKNAAGDAQKDGSNMPLAESKDIATSQQDVEAQQRGDKTAAAKTGDKQDACADKG